MPLIPNVYVEGLGLLVAGGSIGFGFFLLRERRNRVSLAQKGEALVENSRKEAEALMREARLVANEEILKLRDQTEQSLTKRRQEIDESEQRLARREGLINKQLESLVQEEKALREQQLQLQNKAARLESEREGLTRLTQQRK